MLGNLVDNALDAVAGAPDPLGGGRVEQDDGEVRITVRDSGPGVGRDGRAGLPRRASDQGREHGGERGIGLALVRLICRKRGGEVTVHNDDGAVFVRALPPSARRCAP